MSTRNTILTALVTILAVTVIGSLLWSRLPDPMASHWNVNDQVDGYTSKFWGVYMTPVIALGMLALFLLIPYIDPLKANIARFRPTFNLFIGLIVLFLTYVWALTIWWNLGHTDFGMSLALLPALGLLFIFIGVLLRQARRNWFIGIRTPWTLSSDHVWDETHRIGSRLFIVSGILAVAGSLFGRYAFWFIFLPLMGSTLFLVLYSYVLYRREAGG
jgi:uncharacterized membrane protein